MNILSCIKIIPDIEMLSPEDMQVDETLQIDTSFVRKKWNCFDESALEMLLKLSDLSEGFNVIYNLKALTIGNAQCDSFLKTLYALGFKKTIRIEPKTDVRFKPALIAGWIADYCKKRDCVDVIVMGSQSEDDENGKTPYLTAERLNWPCISQVTKIEPVDETTLSIYQNTDEGEQIQKVNVPVVLAIGDAPNSYLRVPTLKDRMRVSKQSIELLTEENFGENIAEYETEQIELKQLERINHTRKAHKILGDTMRQKTEAFYETYMKGQVDSE